MDPTLLNGRCSSEDVAWSIIESSTSNANLAAVLAGFMVTAIIFLLDRRNRKNDVGTAHTISLFLAGVLILGLNSYLFGSIASVRPPVHTIDANFWGGSISTEVVRNGDAAGICGTVWAQGMAASGMLAIGGTLLIAGLGWTATTFAQEEEIDSRFFLSLGNILTILIIWATASLLVLTSKMYLDVMQSTALHTILTPHLFWWLLGVAVAVAIVCTVVIVWKTVALINQPADKRPEEKYRTVVLASIATAVLALVSPVFARLTTEVYHSAQLEMWGAIILCVGAPSIIYVLIASSVPGPFLSIRALRQLLSREDSAAAACWCSPLPSHRCGED